MMILGIELTLTSIGLLLDIAGAFLLFLGSTSWKRKDGKAIRKEKHIISEGVFKSLWKLYAEQGGIILLIIGFILQFIASV